MNPGAMPRGPICTSCSIPLTVPRSALALGVGPALEKAPRVVGGSTEPLMPPALEDSTAPLARREGPPRLERLSQEGPEQTHRAPHSRGGHLLGPQSLPLRRPEEFLEVLDVDPEPHRVDHHRLVALPNVLSPKIRRQ